MITPDKRTRPLPVDGLARATQDGRHRRRVAIGASSGVAAAVAVLALVASSLGGADGRSSLQPAATAAPTPVGTADAAAVARPAPRATPPCAGCGITPPVRPTAVPLLPSPTPKATPPATQPRPDRPYQEAPEVTSAPLQCQTVPNGHAGPVYTGGASACGSAGGGDSTVKQGGSTEVDLGVCASYRGGDIAFGFASGQEHEVLVLDDQDTVVYRFSETVRFTQGAHGRTVKDGTCATYVGPWDTRTTAGRLVPPGSYTLTLVFRPTTENGHPAGSPGTASMSVQVLA